MTTAPRPSLSLRPELQTLFQNPERFMSMVRNGYQPVYRPKTYSFSGVTESEAGLTDTSRSRMPKAGPGRRFTRSRNSPTDHGRSRAAISRRPVSRREPSFGDSLLISPFTNRDLQFLHPVRETR